MDYLNQFRSKLHDIAFRQSEKLYLEVRRRYLYVMIFYFLTCGLYLMMLNIGWDRGLVATAIIVFLQLLGLLFLKIAERGLKQRKIKIATCLSYTNNTLLLAATIGFMIENILFVDPLKVDPKLLYHFGFWWGVFICLISHFSSSWIVKWLQVTSGALIVCIKFRETPELDKLITGTVNLIFLSFWFYHIEERFAKHNFLEKHRANRQADCLQSIIGDLNQGVIVYNEQARKLLYANEAVKNLQFWDENATLQDNFRGLRKRSAKEIMKKQNGVKHSEKEIGHDTTSLSEFYEMVNNNVRMRSSRASYLLDVSFQDKTAEDEEYSYHIQMLGCNYDGQNAWAFIIKDTTERDKIIMLQDNNEYKSRLLASVSHELRTPLNSSITFTEKAMESAETPEHVKNNFLRPSLNSCKLLLNLINDILDFSQMKAHKLRLVFEEKSIANTIKECVNLLSIQAEKKGIYLKIVGLDGITDDLLKTDHNRVRQIILNLLSNALKFTYEGGIILTVKEETRLLEKEKQEIRVICMSVEDTGIGMKPEDQRKLFSTFEKIDLGEKNLMNATGVGLGLVISNDLARSLGPPGRDPPIEVRSEFGVGTTFTFEILDQDPVDQRSTSKPTLHPQKSESADDHSVIAEGDCKISFQGYNSYAKMNDIGLLYTRQPMSRESLIRAPSRQQAITPQLLPCSCASVLIVDDDMFNISSLETILHSKNVTTVSAFNGKIAIDKYLSRENTKCCADCRPFSIIFMDCNMPVMDGYEATSKLKEMMRREEIRECAIIGCTGHVQPSEVEKCKESGMDDCVGKPIERSILMQLLQKYKLREV